MLLASPPRRLIIYNYTLLSASLLRPFIFLRWKKVGRHFPRSNSLERKEWAERGSEEKLDRSGALSLALARPIVRSFVRPAGRSAGHEARV